MTNGGGGANLILGTIFAENCMIMKNIGLRRGVRPSYRTPRSTTSDKIANSQNMLNFLQGVRGNGITLIDII